MELCSHSGVINRITEGKVKIFPKRWCVPLNLYQNSWKCCYEVMDERATSTLIKIAVVLNCTCSVEHVLHVPKSSCL